MKDLVSYLGKFTAMSLGYKTSLYASDYILSLYNHKYKTLSSSNKHEVVTNLNKSAVMLYIFIAFIRIFYNNPEYVFNTSIGVSDASQHKWKMLTMLYACTDFVGLINAEKMPLSTKVHHYGVVIAMGIVLLSDFRGASISKSMVIYGAFSSAAGIVNTYLGSRKILDKKGLLIRILKKLGLISYIIACSANWSWQFKYLLVYLKQPEKLTVVLKFLLNSGLLYSWINDDLKLMRHLMTN
jgi:hypothetical protein